APKVDGREVDYASWPLFEGPFMRSERGSKRLELRYGPMRRVLDFNTLTVSDSIVESREPAPEETAP
ncbi:MAG TPA: hypothetical protein VFG50_13955, partial [Rhodothermales bacterium]|nr:hypothetical protein [Rhodothermales bacterium]